MIFSRRILRKTQSCNLHRKYSGCLLCHTNYLLEQRPNSDSVEDIDSIYDIAETWYPTFLRIYVSGRRLGSYLVSSTCYQLVRGTLGNYVTLASRLLGCSSSFSLEWLSQ